jgi:myo-inositol-1(or 4)-monophosphatase
MILKNELDVLTEAVTTAGIQVEKLRQDGFETLEKGDNQLLTSADLLANNILKDAILTEFPEDGWLSEETADNADRLSKNRLWVVDPIDGTKEFAGGLPEFAVSVGLVINNRPAMGVVFNPATNELYSAVQGEGAWLNGAKIRAKFGLTGRPRILCSRSEFESGLWERHKSTFELIPLGSIAYKLALLGTGMADGALTMKPRSEWDIAAGVVIAHEAGFRVSNWSGKEILFNNQDVIVKGVVAANPAVHDRLLDLCVGLSEKFPSKRKAIR